MNNKRGLASEIFHKKNHKGQFFIIAAVIIIVVIISVVTISNYTSTKEEVKLYDLGQEIGIESQQIIDSGTYSNMESGDMANLLENFANNYVQVIEEKKNIYFVFGNEGAVNVMGRQQIEAEPVCVEIFEIDAARRRYNAKHCDINMNNEESVEFAAGANRRITKVIVEIGTAPDNYPYPFLLREGENFYFVIWRKIRGDKHVVTS